MWAWIETTLNDALIPVSVSRAESAREAFNLLDEQAFDLCVLEYALVDITGPQLCSLVRRMGWNVPMMVFTALDRDIDRQNAMSAGADDYLRKPEDLPKFVASAARLLKKSRPEDRYQPWSPQALRAA
jgi:DNA-binding response OmpR family regulator